MSRLSLLRPRPVPETTRRTVQEGLARTCPQTVRPKSSPARVPFIWRSIQQEDVHPFRQPCTKIKTEYMFYFLANVKPAERRRTASTTTRKSNSEKGSQANVKVQN